jgi:DNA-binding response OmpR family regulator
MRKKLLIVEDNTELLELFRLGLKQAGFSVSTATNGLDAIKKARALSPDLILLDLVLPELDGFAVCERLRHEPSTASTRIIMLTGLTSEFTRYAGLESGADEYVTKPASPDQLLPRIQHWLRQPPRPKRAAADMETPKSQAPVKSSTPRPQRHAEGRRRLA